MNIIIIALTATYVLLSAYLGYRTVQSIRNLKRQIEDK
jgi:hypothetical protein